MTEANTATENTIREESSAPVRTNFELLSDDTFLNDSINNTEEVKVDTKVEDAQAEVAKDLALEPEATTEETKTEEVKTEENSEETLDLEPLSLEDTNSNEPQEGSWAYIAKLDGLELKEDSLDAYKEAITAPYEDRLEKLNQ